MPVVNYLWNPLNDNIVREFDDAGTVIAEYTTEAALFGNVISHAGTIRTASTTTMARARH